MKNTSENQFIQRLIEGNERFYTGTRSVEALMAHKKMPDLAARGQRPFAIVLTCSDSRSPVEMIFDQGVGDLFVVRVAGNVVAPSLLASIEFAAANFESSIVVVLGHTKCGAVNATIEHVENPEIPLPSPHLEELVGRIRPAVDSLAGRNLKADALLTEATEVNVRRSMKLIRQQSQIIANLIGQDLISVHGAILDISSGKVRFL